MDACDPGLDISNLRTLIKQNAGIDLKLSKNQICDVYSLVQGGKLPLPPLILSKDGSYLVDAKSPLTRKDFDTLFSSTSRVSEIRRIAKKVGIVRHADKRLTKQQLTDIIGRRLHSMNVHEPVKLRSVQTKQIEKNAFNNNVNLVNNLNGTRLNNNLNNLNNGNNGNNGTRLNNNLNNGTRLNNNLNNGARLNNNLNNGARLNNNLNNGTRLNNNLNKGNNLSSKIKKNEKPPFLNKQNNRTLTNTKPLIPKREFTAHKPKRPAFLNKSFIQTKTIKPKNGYVFKKGNKGLGMYENVKVTEGPVQGPARGPIEGPKALENRNREIKENEILLRSYLNRENVGKYINNSEKTNVYNRVKQGTKFNSVKTYINGIISSKITNEQRIQNQKIKLEQNRNELQKILNELTNLTNTNKTEILGKFNSNGKLNNAKTLAIQKDRNIKKSKLGNLKLNLQTFLENKNVNNKGTYINRLNAGEDISNLKREILGITNKKNANRKNYDLKLKELSVLLNSSKNLNNSMKAKFLRNFEKTRNFNTVKKNVEDEMKKIKNARNQGEISFKNDDQKKLLQKILNNSKNFTNDDKRMFMQRLEAGNNFNTLKGNVIQEARNLSKKRKNRELEQKMKAEAEYKNEQRREQRKLMNKIMNNSGLFNNAEKNVFRQRFNSGNNFNTIKTNVINKARQLKEERVRKEKEMLENQEKKRIRNEQQRLLSKILNNSKNMTNENKLPFLQRLNKGENFNTVKGNAIRKAQNMKRNRIQNEKNELNRKAKEEENRLAKEKANQNAKNEANRLAKEKENQNAKNEANRKAKEEEAIRKEKEQKQKLLSKILNNSKNLTNTNKMAFLKRFEKGENFNAIKKNAIGKAKELSKQRKEKEEANRKAKEKEEANRKAKEEMIAKKKEEALAKKKKEDEEKKKKEAENKKKAAQNTQMRASLTKKVKSTQMDQKVKNKLLNQLKNYSVQIRNVAPGIEKTIESEKLNGNYNEAANKKKRQEVKKQLAEYITKTYPNMSKANRGKYIQRANLTQWKKGFLSGSQGMGANKAFERIKGNIRENMKAQKPPPPQKNKKANLKKLVNNTMKGRAAKNVSRLKKNINEGVSEMAVKTRLAQLNKQTKYQK